MSTQSNNILNQVEDVLREIFIASNFTNDQVTELTKKSITMLNKRILLKSIEALERDHRELVIQQIKSQLNKQDVTLDEQDILINMITTNIPPETFVDITTNAIKELVQPLLVQFAENANDNQITTIKAKLTAMINPDVKLS